MPTCFRYTDYAILNRAKKKKRVMVLTKSKCSLDCSPKIELVIDIRRWTSALNQNEQLKWGFQVVGKAYICRIFTKLAISVLLVVLVSLRFFIFVHTFKTCTGMRVFLLDVKCLERVFYF